LAPLLTDSFRWRYLIIDYKNKAVVKKMTDAIERYSFEENTETEELVFKSSTDSISQKFTYSISDSNVLKLKGDSLNISFKKVPTSKFRLLNRKFHWINETIYKY
jgi:hypothetical protein